MPKVIKAELDETSGTSVSTFENVYNSMIDFKQGRTSASDGLRSGSSLHVSTPDKMGKIHGMKFSDRRVTFHELVEETGIYDGTVFQFSIKIYA